MPKEEKWAKISSGPIDYIPVVQKRTIHSYLLYYMKEVFSSLWPQIEST